MKLLGVALLVVLPFACVDQDFDAPPAGGMDPDLTVNATIAEIKAMHTEGQFEQMTEDLVIAGLVVSSDEAGNFFRQLVIQDESGGIELRIEATNLYTVYPVGRRVFVKLKGLWLGDFAGLTQIGGSMGVDDDGDPELTRIPESLLDDVVLPGTYGHAVTPAIKTIDELGASDVSTLIQLERMQFVSANLGSTFADTSEERDAFNLNIEDCNRDRLILRTSGFADFAGEVVPPGNGTVTGVLGIFNGDLQIVMRDLDDISMNGERCQVNTVTLAAVREAYNGGQGVPAGVVQGIVISDRSSGNHVGQNLFLEDNTGGIVIRFRNNHGFDFGDEISVNITGLDFEDFNGLLQVDQVPLDQAEVVTEGNTPSPRMTTVNEVLTNAQNWESTLVQIPDVLLSGSSTFSGELTVTDATGSMLMFTRAQANFANDAVPEDMVDITAIISQFSVPQLVLNTRADVSGGGSSGGDLNESFNSLNDDDDIVLPGWTNMAIEGTRIWRVQVFDGNHYAQATAFNDAAPQMETWLVTPPIDVSEPKTLTFNTAQAFWVHDGLTVWSSTDFDGDVETATWEPVDARIAESTDTEHAWIPSGDIDLSGFPDPVYIAFRYVGSGPGGETTSYRVDDIVVTPQ